MSERPADRSDAFRVLEQDTPSDSFPPLGQNIKALMIWPRFPASFWGFEGVLEIIPERAMTPPLGLITVAALCPSAWDVRLIDRAFEALTDDDLLWADLVMVSAMHAQRFDAIEVLNRARALGRRTIIGGPWASSDPDAVRAEADHVLAGEAEDIFPSIAAALEDGTARKLYQPSRKPDLTTSPVPRFDLLRREKYLSMPVQFSRGCPFQCEFCDIITIYGRKPRTKTPAQLIEELEVLRSLGWTNEVFIVDDNFIGNGAAALQLARAVAVWQNANNRPFSLYTEASIDLADRPELLAAMVDANFLYVFIGIETPSAEALQQSRKFQNLRKDNLAQIRAIQQAGLWVLGGFIVGFDSDDETIFDRQFQFIEQSAIAWAMAGVLQAPPTTALYERLEREGRLNKESRATSNFSAPNFDTVMPTSVLLRGLADLLHRLYAPEVFFSRSLRSLEVWRPDPRQRPPEPSFFYTLRVWLASMWKQGLRSDYCRAYWKFTGRLISKWRHDPAKMWLGFSVSLSAHHFVIYARQVAAELEQECRNMETSASRAEAPLMRSATAGAISSRQG
jgi:radical SAM superfamily enzyme YgiQ (UPF0313 family)